MNEKIEFWLKNLSLYALNADVHCSREEKVIGKEMMGTRYVNLALKGLLTEMHADLGYEYKKSVEDSVVLEGGLQVLLFKLGDEYYYTDLSLIHEVITYPKNNYYHFDVKDNAPMVGIINWYEGMMPIIQSHLLIGEDNLEENYALIYDIDKEMFAFTISDFIGKFEIEPNVYGEIIHVNQRKFTCLEFVSYEKQLIQTRLNFKL